MHIKRFGLWVVLLSLAYLCSAEDSIYSSYLKYSDSPYTNYKVYNKIRNIKEKYGIYDESNEDDSSEKKEVILKSSDTSPQYGAYAFSNTDSLHDQVKFANPIKKKTEIKKKEKEKEEEESDEEEDDDSVYANDLYKKNTYPTVLDPYKTFFPFNAYNFMSPLH